MAVDPRNHFGGGAGTRKAHAVDVESTVVGRTYGVDHRVVMRQKFVMGQVRSHLDVEVEPEPSPPGDPVEQPRHPLGALVVGGDPGPHQPVRRRQPFEDVDPHPVLGQQFVGGIHGRGSGADDRHRQRPACARLDISAPRVTGASFDVGGSLRLALRIERGVQLDERQLLGLQPGVGCDRADRARAHARAAVDARRRDRCRASRRWRSPARPVTDECSSPGRRRHRTRRYSTTG